ncbi:MAG: hypothetical protein ACKOYJ_00775 [Planctomycetia bacterium]
MTPDKDPWADLAESLGASSGQQSEPPRAQQPAAPRPQPPKQPSRPRPEAPKGGDWGGLANELGLQQSHDSAAEQPRPPAREPARPRPRIDELPRESQQTDMAAAAGDVASEGRDQRPPRSREEGGEGREGRENRGRRRRGRRGGLGRRDESQGEGRIDAAGDDRRQLSRDFREDAGGSAETRERSQRRDDLDERDERGDRSTNTIAGEPGASDLEPSAEDGGDRPRRRRRGRRGGRRRGRSTRERLADERASAEQPETERRPDEFDDEPLATAYGATPRQRPSDRAESDRPAGGTEEGERRGRRRRRRRRGNGEPRPATGSQAGTETGRQSRRSEESRSGSRSSSRSRRRDDFAPVAGRFDEDDEGLEFLGVEEAGRAAAPGRERRPPQDDDVLAESGLDTVREVPSWVEAIGIVIAANLDARSRSGQRKETR